MFFFFAIVNLPLTHPKKDIKNSGQCIKRPTLAYLRLSHYSGNKMMFKFLNHISGREEFLILIFLILSIDLQNTFLIDIIE